jgi:dUTP pyrophosphatase
MLLYFSNQIGPFMRIKPIHPNFSMPTKSTTGAGAFDIYMPHGGHVFGDIPTEIPLGFAAEVPQNHVALILPRSGVGAKHGLELNNTCGVIDSDYRGEWKAFLRLKNGAHFSWKPNERLLQFLIVPVTQITLELAEELTSTDRNTGGFGSSGK